MELFVDRFKKGDIATLGRLTIANNAFTCCTLEDKDRGLTGDMPPADLARIKVWGQTCIPPGRYQIKKGYWQKHKRTVMWLQGVPGFDRIYIHMGNRTTDTDGCLLVGAAFAGDAFITTSGKTLEALEKIVFEALDRNEEVWITIQ